MPVKLYHFPASGPSRGALLAARAVGAPVEVAIVDLFKREQFNESFVKINPQHCVPTLDDDGFVLWESRAIACYLAEKYGKDETLYPKDLKQRAIVNQRLYFDASTLYVKIRAICYPILYKGVTEISEDLKQDLDVALGFLNQFLEGNRWVASGGEYTIADCCMAASVSSILAVGWELTEFPNIKMWIKDCERIPGFEENLEGAKIFGDAVKSKHKHLVQKHVHLFL